MAAILYFVTGAAALWIAGRFVEPLTRRAAVALLLLPLCFTGRALLTGRIYAPIDLAYASEPLSSLADRYGIERIHNPALSDVQLLMIPWREAVRFAIAQGEWPLWNPFIFCGDILAANAEPAPYHPTNLLALLLPVAQSLTFAATMTYLLAGLCMFLYLRDLGIGEPAALFGAAAWMFSSFIVFFVEYPLGNAALLLPLVFLGVRRILRGPSLLLLAALVLLNLAGHPETTLHVVAFGIAYALVEIVIQRPRVGPVILRGVTAGLLSLLLTAFFLLPFVDALVQSHDFASRGSRYARESPSVSWKEARERTWIHLIPFIYGDPTAETPNVPSSYQTPHSGYAGSLLFPLAAFGLWRSRWKGRWFMAVLIVIGWLAASKAPGVSDVLAAVPPFDIALNERLVFGAAAALVILASLGLDGCETKTLSFFFVAFVLGLFLILAWHWKGMVASGLSPTYLHAGTIRLLVPLTLAAGVVLLGRLAVPLLLVLLLLQRVVEAGGTYPTLPATAYYPSIPVLEKLKRGELARVVGKSFSLIPNTSIHYRLEDPRGFHGMTFARLYETFPLWCIHQPVWFNRVEELDRNFLDFMNVRYAIVPGSSGVQLLERPAALPRAFVPWRVRINSPEDEVVHEMRANSNFLALSWINGSTGSSGEFENGPGKVDIRRRGFVYEIAATMQDPGWIIVSETAWRGWKAEAEGRKLPLAFANHAFLAIHAPAGRSMIQLRYLPDSFAWGLMLSAAAAASLLAWAMARKR